MSHKQRDYLIVSFVALAEALTHFATVEGDSLEYFNVTKYLLGLEPLEYPQRIIRPLVPALAAPLYNVLGLPMSYGIVNTIFYVLSGMVSYELTMTLTGNRMASLISSLLLVTSPPMIAYGAASHYQVAPTFFQFLVALLAVRFVTKLNIRRTILLGIISGIGVLGGESVATAILFACLWLLFKGRRLLTIAYLVTILPFLSIPTILGGYDWIKWYFMDNLAGYAPYAGLDNPIAWLDPFNRTRHFVVGISFLGVIGLFYGFMREADRARLVTFYLLFVTAIIAWLAWPPVSYRIAYPLFHAVFWMAGVGVNHLVNDLLNKPILRVLSPRLLLATFVIVNAIINNWYVVRYYYMYYSPTIWGPYKWASIPSMDMLSFK